MHQRAILLVEDDPSVRTVLTRLLSAHRFQVLAAADARSAQSIWQEYALRIAVLITDLLLPGGASGSDIAERFQHERPELQVIFTSGYNTDYSDGTIAGGNCFIAKPYRPDQLLALVRKAFATATSSQLCTKS